MKPSLVWLLVGALAAAGCRASSKLATCGDGVEPITVASAPKNAAPTETNDSSPPAAAGGGVQLAAYELEELPPVTLVNPAETAAAPAQALPELLPAPLGETTVATLDDVITSVYASYPALDAAARERQIAAGKQLASMGKFESNVVGQAITEPLG